MHVERVNQSENLSVLVSHPIVNSAIISQMLKAYQRLLLLLTIVTTMTMDTWWNMWWWLFVALFKDLFTTIMSRWLHICRDLLIAMVIAGVATADVELTWVLVESTGFVIVQAFLGWITNVLIIWGEFNFFVICSFPLVFALWCIEVGADLLALIRITHQPKRILLACLLWLITPYLIIGRLVLSLFNGQGKVQLIIILLWSIV